MIKDIKFSKRNKTGEGKVYLLKKGNYELEHYRFLDDLGLWREVFDIKHFLPNGSTIHYPFMERIKMSNYNKNSPISAPINYTHKEYEEMFDEKVKKLLNN